MLVSCLAGILIAAGGYYCFKNNLWPQAKYERTEQFSVPMTGIEVMDVNTKYGNISFCGANTADCNVTAKITGYW